MDTREYGLHSLRAGGATAAGNLRWHTVCLNAMAVGDLKYQR